MKKLLILIGLLLLGGLMAAPYSFAQDGEEDPTSSVFTGGDPNDRTITWLNQLFPELGDDDRESTPVNVLAKLMKILSLTLISLGFIWAGAAATGKLVQSNFDGKTLAQAKGQTMSVMRLLGAITALFPLPSGFPLVSYLVFTIAVWGVNLGNALWNKTVDALVEETTAVVQPAPSDAEGLAKGLLIAETCMATINAIARESSVTPEILVERNEIDFAPSAVSASPTDVVSSQRFGLSYDGVEDSNLGEAICGLYTAEIPAADPEVGALVPSPGYIIEYQLGQARKLAEEIAPIALGFANTQFDSETAKDIVTGTANSIDGLNENVRDAIIAYYDGHNEFVSGFEKKVTTKAEEEAKTLGGQMKEGGWSSAGTWWLKILQINNQIRRYIDTLPEEKERLSLEGGHDSAALQPLLGKDGLGRVEKTIALVERFRDEGFLTSKTGLNVYLEVDMRQSGQGEKTSKGGSNSLGEDLVFVSEELIDPSSEKLTAFQASLRKDPIRSVLEFGQELMGVVSDFMQKLSVEGGADNEGKASLGSIGTLLAAPLFVTGVFLSFVMPIQIFIHFSLAVIGWFIAVIEAVLASPIWALMHMRIQGHQAIPFQTKAGYKMLLALFLRPALMILGFVVGIGVYYIAMAFVGEQYIAAVTYIYPAAKAQAPVLDGTQYNFYEAVGVVTFIGLFLVFAMAVMKLSTRLMTALPDQIMSRWVGVSSTNPLVEGARSEVDGKIEGSRIGKSSGGGVAAQPNAVEARSQLQKLLGGEPEGKNAY